MRAMMLVLCASGLAMADTPKKPAEASYDFVIVDDDCQLLGSAIATVPKAGKPIATGPGSKGATLCWREKRNAHCVYKYEDSDKPIELNYSIDVDTATLLQLSGLNGDVLYLNPSEHVAVVTARQYATKSVPMVMMKLCRGTYLTHDEFEALRSKQAK
jgi:hypothetical protein